MKRLDAPNGLADGPGADQKPMDRSASSRQAILSAARDLFSTVGYSATSVSDIVAAAGRSVGLPYYHFGSKKKIFLALWEEYQSVQEERTRVATHEGRRAGLTGKELLLVGVRAYLEGAYEARDIVPMMHGRETPADFDTAMSETSERWSRQNLALLAGCDPHLAKAAAVLLNGALGSLCIELAKCATDKQAKRLIDDAVILFGGLLTELSRVGS